MVSEIQYIKSIGPKRANALLEYEISTIKDLIDYFPRRYLDRSKIVTLNDLSKGIEVTVVGKIERVGIRRSRKPVFYLIISDGKGMLEAVWFQYINQYKNIFQVNRTLYNAPTMILELIPYILLVIRAYVIVTIL